MSKRCQRNRRSKWHSTRQDQEPAPTEREARTGSSQPWRCGQEMGICRWGEAGEAFQELHLMILKVFADLRDSLGCFLHNAASGSSRSAHGHRALTSTIPRLQPGLEAPTGSSSHSWLVGDVPSTAQPSLQQLWGCTGPAQALLLSLFGMDRQEILLRPGDCG